MSLSIMRLMQNLDGDQIGNFGSINPFTRFHSDFNDFRPLGNHIRGGMLPLQSSIHEELASVVGEDAAKFILKIGLSVQMLPGTPLRIDNASQLRDEFELCNQPGSNRQYEIMQMVPQAILDVYEQKNYANYPVTISEWRAMPEEVAAQYKGFNGHNFHVDEVTIDENGDVSLTLMLMRNKLLDAEMEARKIGFPDSEYSARQFHVSEIAVVVDEYGDKYLAVQAKNIWANNAGEIQELSADGTILSPDTKLRLYHPALVAGGVPVREVLVDGKPLVSNPALFGLQYQVNHELGPRAPVYASSDPIAFLHEGSIGIAHSNKLPRSLYCNAQHVTTRTDGSPITVDEVIRLQHAYAENIYPAIKAQGRGPEVRGCAFIPLSGGTFEVINGLNKDGKQGTYLCIRGVKTVAISPEGVCSESVQDIILDSAYTGFLKHLLVDGDPLRELIFHKANIT